MDNTETLNKLKQFESLIKKCLTVKFGKFLPENKIAILNFQSFVDEEMIKQCGDDDNKLRGAVLRTLLDNIVDVKCKKSLKVEGKLEEIDYGEYLEEALVEDYARYFSQMYKFGIDIKPDMEEQLKAVQVLKEKLGQDFDKLVLNNDANTLLAIAGSPELIAKADEDAIKRHIDMLKEADSINDKNTNVNEKLQNNFEKKGQINIIYLKGKQYVKYVDSNDVVHLVETENEKKVSKLYKEKIKAVGIGNRINPEDFFKELTSITPEINLTATKDVEPEYVNHEEVNMISFIHSASPYRDGIKKDKVTHSDDASIHVLEGSNDVVVTDIGYNDTVKSQVVASNNNGISDSFSMTSPQKVEDNSDIILSPEKYEELCESFKSGKNLTLEELRALKKYEEMYMKEYGNAPKDNVGTQEIEEKRIDSLEEAGPVLRMNSGDKRYAGYTNKYFVAYIIIMTICIGIILGAAIFKILH